MRKWKLNVAVFCFFFCMNSAIFAANSSDTMDDYFAALAQIKKAPAHSMPVLPCNIAEKKQFFAWLKQDDRQQFNDLTLTDNGQIHDRFDEQVELYRGNFSNENVVEYAL